MTDATKTLDPKREKLLNLLSGYGRVAVAFSAGVDSTVVAKAAQLACGDKAVAVTAVSSSLAEGEVEQAVELARLIDIEHRVIETREFEDPNYVANPSNRCYFCKTELYTRLGTMRDELDVDVVVNGANLDDVGDYRPGMQAANEHAVRSPLIEAGLNKAEVRELARDWQLPVWDKPAAPCLASRIAYGIEVTPERTSRIDQAERFLRGEFGLRELRVRHEANDLARIEVPVDAISQLMEPQNRSRITAQLHALGFQYVAIDLDGFRSGSMNAVIPVESLKMLNRS